ncbi:MAG: hypothetical protein V5A56_14890 [Halolamina sp.]
MSQQEQDGGGESFAERINRISTANGPSSIGSPTDSRTGGI